MTDRDREQRLSQASSNALYWRSERDRLIIELRKLRYSWGRLARLARLTRGGVRGIVDVAEGKR